MNRLSLIASASAVAVLLTTGAAAVPMNAKTVEYVVRNATGLDAEDLEFNFLEEGISTGQSRSFRNFFTTPDTSGITFNSGKVINGAQDTGAITFKTKGPYTLASAFWSFPGPQQQPIQIPLRNVTIDGGKKLSSASPTGLQGYMLIANPDPTATLFITLLGLAIDIPIALYDPADPTFQDNLRIPDGTAVSGFDTMFSLGPGDVRNFDLGPVNATDYEAMQFFVSASSFCSELSDTCSVLGLASDVTLPEPGTLSIFAIALAGVVLVRRRPRATISCRDSAADMSSRRQTKGTPHPSPPPQGQGYRIWNFEYFERGIRTVGAATSSRRSGIEARTKWNRLPNAIGRQVFAFGSVFHMRFPCPQGGREFRSARHHSTRAGI